MAGSIRERLRALSLKHYRTARSGLWVQNRAVCRTIAADGSLARLNGDLISTEIWTRDGRFRVKNYSTISIHCGKQRRRCRAPLQNSRCPFKRRPPERWPSGLRRTLGKRVCGKPYRGFESHSLRQHDVLPHSPLFAKSKTIIKNFVLLTRHRLQMTVGMPTSNVGRNGGTNGANDASPLGCKGQEQQGRYAL
jgi:hypothetical protein